MFQRAPEDWGANGVAKFDTVEDALTWVKAT